MCLLEYIAWIHNLALIVDAGSTRNEHLTTVTIVDVGTTLETHTIFIGGVEMGSTIEVMYLLLLNAINGICVKLYQVLRVCHPSSDTCAGDKMGI